MTAIDPVACWEAIRSLIGLIAIYAVLRTMFVSPSSAEMNSVELFEQVHRGELTSDEAAEIIMQERERRKLSWLRDVSALGATLLVALSAILIGRCL